MQKQNAGLNLEIINIYVVEIPLHLNILQSLDFWGFFLSQNHFLK